MQSLSSIVPNVPPGFKQMASGKGVDLDDPRPEVIDFNDIAIGLALQCRFTGAMRDPLCFYSIAQHSVLVACLLPEEYRLRGLLHDAHEAYWGDDSTPKKNYLRGRVPDAADALRDAKRRWDVAIWKAAGLGPPTDKEARAVKEADVMALAIERRDLLAPAADGMTERAWSWLPEPYANIVLCPLPPRKAHIAYLDMLGVWPWGREGGWA